MWVLIFLLLLSGNAWGQFSGGTASAIIDGVTGTIAATVKDLTNSNPLTAAIVDADGNQITSFGGGTQYNQGTAGAAADAMTMAGCVRTDFAAVDGGVADGDRVRCITDATGRIWVRVGTIDGGTITTVGTITNAVTVTDGAGALNVIVDSGTLTVSDGAGALNVICDSGCGGAATFEDDDPFTATTTPVNIMGALYDTTPPTVTDGNAAAVRMNANRQLMVDGSAVTQPVSGTVAVTDGGIIKDGAGDTTQANVSTGRLHVDGSGVTQPISGTVTADAGTNLNTSALLTTTAHNDAFGTAGTADTQVRSVQGIASMTPLQVQSNSANIATESTLGNVLTSTNFAAAFGTAGAADTQVMSIQGIAAMTKLLVTPDSVALPANQSVNINQINGASPLMGNGATGTGSHRVTIATDSTGVVRAQGNAGAAFDSAIGAAPPANAIQLGGLKSGATGGFMTGIPVCDSFVNVNVSTATTTLLITGVTSRHVRICSMSLVTAAANNVALISGTGATCGTGTTGMNGGTTAATGWNFAANGGITQGDGLGTINQTNAVTDSVCIVTSAATQLSGRIAYTIY